jgi:hypothetical protein
MKAVLRTHGGLESDISGTLRDFILRIAMRLYVKFTTQGTSTVRSSNELGESADAESLAAACFFL